MAFSIIDYYVRAFRHLFVLMIIKSSRVCAEYVFNYWPKWTFFVVTKFSLIVQM